MSANKATAIATALKKKIEEGKYGAGNPMPSVRALMRQHGVARSTANRALQELSRMGLVRTSPGSGTFVRSRSVHTIGMIVPGVAVTDFFQPIMSEINQLARAAGCTLVFAEVFSLERKERFRQVRDLAADFIKRGVSGVIYEPLAEPNGNAANEHILRAMRRARIPVVLLDCDLFPFPDRSEYDVVGVNDVEAGAKIARHLVEAGAKKIHFLISSLRPTTFLNRLYGAEAELIRRGLFEKDSVLHAEPDDLAALKRHIRRHGKPDAFVCSNDPSAALFCKTLEKVGLSVPRDILLTGFADLSIASLMTPTLTTIHQSRDKMGEAAFRRLMDRIANPSLPPCDIFFPAPLVVRGSTEKGKVLAQRRRVAEVMMKDVE